MEEEQKFETLEEANTFVLRHTEREQALIYISIYLHGMRLDRAEMLRRRPLEVKGV